MFGKNEISTVTFSTLLSLAYGSNTTSQYDFFPTCFLPEIIMVYIKNTLSYKLSYIDE